MASLPLFQIDAFADRPFGGNPAAVCFLDRPRDEGWMQAVAAEMNLSETAFVRPLPEGFELRWFTPKVEVALCGHATLASAHALWTTGRVARGTAIRFHTQSGVLAATGEDAWIHLDFPATPATPCEAPPDLIQSLGVQPSHVARTKTDVLFVINDATILRSLEPDFRRLEAVDLRGVIVTAASDDPRYDFLSRFFAPAVGVDEDPVTGSAHCCLGPYWSERLAKPSVVGYQASRRGGIVRVATRAERVMLSGQAVTVFAGELMA